MDIFLEHCLELRCGLVQGGKAYGPYMAAPLSFLSFRNDSLDLHTRVLVLLF